MKALTRLEAEAYLIKYMKAGADAQLAEAEKMVKNCTDPELVDVFEAITGQGLILPASSDGIVDAAGDRIEIPQKKGDVNE